MSIIKQVDDLFEAENANQEAAALQIQSWQAVIKPGDFFVRSEMGLTIYGKVMPDSESDGAYRFTRCFSEMCPEGELGDMHISTVTRILTKAEFLAAKKTGWPT